MADNNILNNAAATVLEAQQETKEVIDFLHELTPEENKEMIAFVQGARFARHLQNIKGA